MNVFTLLRLGIWSVLLAGCLVLCGIYWTVQSTLLTSANLHTIVQQSALSETVRRDILLPRVLQATQGSDYAALLDNAMVTAAFDAALPSHKLDAQLTPATEAIAKWLNSTEPTVTFSIDMSSLSHDFAAALATKANDKLASLAPCTYQNTLADAQTGVCRSERVTKEALAGKIKQFVASDPTLATQATLTPDSIGLRAALDKASDAPTYLNLLYATTIIAGGVAVLITLWLLLKHRLYGLVTIGVAGGIAAGILYCLSIFGLQPLGTLSDNVLLQQAIRAVIGSFEASLQREAAYALGISAVLVAVSTLLIIARKKHRHASSHVRQLGTPSSTDD